MALGGCADFCVGKRLDAFPASRWRDEPSPAVVRRQDAMVASEIDSGFWHQGGQSRYEIQWLEDDMGGPVAKRCLQLIAHLAGGGE